MKYHHAHSSQRHIGNVHFSDMFILFLSFYADTVLNISFTVQRDSQEATTDEQSQRRLLPYVKYLLQNKVRYKPSYVA